MALSNTRILIYVLGWQGGTLTQVAQELGVAGTVILEADEDGMDVLCRMAQRRENYRGAHAMELFTALKPCVEALQRDFIGHTMPTWLQRALNTLQRMREVYLSSSS